MAPEKMGAIFVIAGKVDHGVIFQVKRAFFFNQGKTSCDAIS